MSADPNQTEATLTRHLQAFAKSSVDGVMQDYTQDSIFIIPDRALHGPDEIRGFFKPFIENLPDGFLEAFKIRKLEIVGELGYLLWEAAPWVLLGTDTFVVRNGRIVMQTFAPYPLPAVNAGAAPREAAHSPAVRRSERSVRA